MSPFYRTLPVRNNVHLGGPNVIHVPLAQVTDICPGVHDMDTTVSEESS